jgi:hypothetical protein
MKVDWDDLNQKSNRFAAVLEIENGNQGGDDVMDDDDNVQPDTKTVTTRQPVSSAVRSPVAEQPAGLDEDEEIT